MKTTVELPDELVREVKIRAVRENRKLKDVMADLLRRGLDAEEKQRTPVRKRVQLPLIRGTHPARPGHELTPDRVAEILLDEEVRAATER